MQAQKLYSNLPAHYVELRWAKIEALLLTRCIDLQEGLVLDKDRLLSTLALVRAGVEFESKIWQLEGFGLEGEELAKKLMEDIYRLAGLLSKGELRFELTRPKTDDCFRFRCYCFSYFLDAIE